MSANKTKVDYEINKFFEENPDSIFIVDKDKILNWVYIQGYDDDNVSVFDENFEFQDKNLDPYVDLDDIEIGTDIFYHEDDFKFEYDEDNIILYPENSEYNLGTICFSYERGNIHCNIDWMKNLLSHTYTRIPLIKSSKNLIGDEKIEDDIKKFSNFMIKLKIKVYIFKYDDDLKWGSAHILSCDDFWLGRNNMIILCNIRRGYDTYKQDIQYVYKYYNYSYY